MVKIRGDVQKTFGLVFDSMDHSRVAVTGRADGNARREIDEAIPIHIPDFAVLSTVHHERVGPRVGWRDDHCISL
jgi:hypothetical protein